MAQPIEELLHRRTDLSTFLVHFTNAYGDNAGRVNLLNIMDKMCLHALNPYGMGMTLSYDQAFQDSQKVACFTETPLEHAWMICSDIEGRGLTLGPYGGSAELTSIQLTNPELVWGTDSAGGYRADGQCHS